MTKQSKRIKNIYEALDKYKQYELEEALQALQTCLKPKFDESVDLSIRLGIDPKKSDQQVRGTVALPHGTGKSKRVLVLARGEKVQEALAAGAEFAGNDEYLEKIKGGWTDIDAIVATPEMMRDIGKLGKILGPRGLMPTPKGGTVTTDVAKAVEEIKAGKVEFKVDRSGVINLMVGKLSFDKSKLKENIVAVLSAIQRAKPPGAKGVYMQSLFLSSTMGPGLKIANKELNAA